MRKYSFMFRSSGLLTAAFLATGCLSRGTDEADLFAPAPPTYAEVDFATLSSAVLAPHCIQCHAEFGSQSGVLAYVTPGNPGASLLYTDIQSGQMPPGGPSLPAASLQVVATYINDLVQAPPAKTSPTPAPSPGPSASPLPMVTFATLNSQVLTPMCIQCHPGFNSVAGIASYVVAGDPEHSSLYLDAKSGAMPPGGPAVSTDGLATIYDYILALPGSQ